MDTVFCMLMAIYFMLTANSDSFNSMRKFLHFLSILCLGMGVLNMIT